MSDGNNACRGGAFKHDQYLVFYYAMFDENGKRRLGPNGNQLGFDDIWQNILQLDDDECNGENTGRDIILARFKELEAQMPDYSSVEIKANFRAVAWKLYQGFRQG